VSAVDENVRNLLDRADAMKRKAATPEQAERRRLVDERNERMQERGVKPPKSGFFGRPPK
jgi:hypothetical protein